MLRKAFYCPLFCLLCFLLIYNQLFAEPTIIKTANIYSLNQNSWSYLTTNKKSVPINIITYNYQQGNFRPVGQSVFNGGITKEYYWFHFSLFNADSIDNEMVIDIESPRLNELELFEQDSLGMKSLGKLGDFYTFNQRKITHKNFIYNSLLKKGEVKEYYLYINQVGHTLILPIHFYKNKIFEAASFKNYLTDGLTYGILLFVSILSFLFFINSKHYLYLFYALYVLTAIAWFLSYFGLGYQYIWGNYPYMSTVAAPLFASLNLIANIQICQTLLQLNKVDRSLYVIANIAKSLLFVCGVFPLIINLNKSGYTLNHIYLVSFLVTATLSILIVFVSVLSYSIKGSTVARFYLISSILKIGSILNLAFLELGLTLGLYNMEGILQAGIITEITLLLYAIAKRYTNYKIKSFKQVIAAQEKEREELSKEIHDSISNTLASIWIGFKIILNKEGVSGIGTIQIDKNQLEEIANEINEVQNEARNISHYMMPDYIVEYPLPSIIEKYISYVQSKSKNIDNLDFPTIQFSTNEQSYKFSNSVKLNIFRIVQELIANTVKHSKAKNVGIEFSFKKNNLMITLKDDGIGFDFNSANTNGIGLNNIRSRVKTLNGSLDFQPLKNDKNDSSNNLIDVSEVAFKNITGTFIHINIPFKYNLNQNRNAFDY